MRIRGSSAKFWRTSSSLVNQAALTRQKWKKSWKKRAFRSFFPQLMIEEATEAEDYCRKKESKQKTDKQDVAFPRSRTETRPRAPPPRQTRALPRSLPLT